MKHLKVNFISGDDGYEEVSGAQKYPKWAFKEPGMSVLECVLMDRKSLPQKQGSGTYDIYTVMQKDTKKPFAFFCGKVLEDKLKNIPTFSLVRIAFTGTHPTKRYDNFKVDLNRNFRFDPATYNLDDYAEVKSDTNPSNPANAGNGAIQKGVAAQQVDEDLPF